MKEITNTHEWCASIEDAQIELLQGIPFERFGYHKKQLLNLETIRISSIEDYPSEAKSEKEWVKEHGFRSLLYVPIILGGKLHGTIGVYGEIGKELDWPEDYVVLLRILGTTLSSSLERKLAEETLRESEERFRGFMQSANEVFILYDKDMRFVEVNDSWLQRSGLKEEDVIGKHILEVSPMLKETGRYEAYLKVLETGEPVEFHAIDSVTAPGKIIEIKAFKTGNFLGLISRDMSEQKRFQERLEALHFYGSKLAKAVSIEEISHITLDAVESVFGYHYCDFNVVLDDYLVPIQLTDDNLQNNLDLHVDGPGIIVRAYKTGESQLVHDTRLDESYVYGRGEDTEWLSELAVPVKVKDEIVAIINLEHRELGAFTESDQKLIETLAIHVASAFESLRARETHNNVYRQMIDQKLRVEQAQELERIKNNFIMKATHELRTPLAIIKGYSELLLEDGINSNPETLVDFLSVILKNVKRSEILINDLLDESQLKSGKYVLNLELNDSTNLVNVVKNEAEIFLKPKNQQLSVRIQSGVQPFLFDKERLYQVLMNLVMNASKFSDFGSEIRLVVEDNVSEVKISIIDEGVGIREEDLGRIFQPFPGIEEGTIQPGVGIGLSICKGIVELHGGEIWAESQGLGKGSTLIFTIPVNRR